MGDSTAMMEVDEPLPNRIANTESKKRPLELDEYAEREDNQPATKKLKTLDMTDVRKSKLLEKIKAKTKPGQPNTDIAGLCEVWTGYKDIGGYGQISVGKRMKLAHRAAYELYHNVELEPGIQVHRLCANPLCVAKSHLAIGTAKDNGNDRVESGRSMRGEKHTNAKITAADALTIFQERNLTVKQCASRFCCSEESVRQIRRGNTWNSVTGAERKELKPRNPSDLVPKDEVDAKRYIEERVEKIMEDGHEHWVWKLSIDVHGYGQAVFHGKHYRAPILSWRAFNGCKRIPNGKQVCHGCKNRKCVNPNGLRLGTRQENMADRVRDGTDSHGEKNPQAKLTEQKVEEIRKLKKDGTSNGDLASMFGVSTRNIRWIISGQTWNHAMQSPNRDDKIDRAT